MTIVKYKVPSDYYVILTLDLQRREYNQMHDLNIGFPDWMKQKFNCTISYEYNSSVITHFNFETEKELTWFLLTL